MNRRFRFRPAVRAVTLAAVALLVSTASLEAQERYREPPGVVMDILDAPPEPYLSVSPSGDWMVMSHRASMPSIEEQSRPMLRLAGLRIDPSNNSLFGSRLITGYTVREVDGDAEVRVQLPEGTGWGLPQFSPDGEAFVFTRKTGFTVELWTADPETGQARQLLSGLNEASRSGACTWLPDSSGLLCQTVLPNRGAPPQEPAVPQGPVVQETMGVDAPVRTYQDLLEDPHDVALWEFYRTSVPVRVSFPGGEQTPVGPAAIYVRFTPSPSGEYFLTERIVPPYSYLVTERSFPRVLDVRDASGEPVATLARTALADAVPIGGVRTGPRSHGWIAGDDHRLLWVEALDGGDPRAEAEVRDRIFTAGAPFNQPAELTETAFRYAGLVRGSEGATLLNEYDRPSRTLRTWVVELDRGRVRGEPRALWERNAEDRYGDPGQPVMVTDESGHRVMLQDGRHVYLRGAGASDEGDRPFLDRLDLRSGETERLWRAASETYETVVAVLDEGRVLTRFESKTEPPNYYLRDLDRDQRVALTTFEDPAPELNGVTKQFVVYERDDGVRLSGTLYLPPDYQEGTRLPTVVWAYPREYVNPDVAGQVRGSPHRFTRISGPSHLFFLTQGYAVFDGPTMPIIGGDTANNSYVDQLVSSARAAVDKVVEMGVADPARVGVGGHSYGAFMTANLLAHSDIFRAGIARSGAYNRTLTPFGFQSERRTFWEAPEIYFAMSPFMHAGDIDEPMLMIHGIADNNSGTFPVQSRRMYHAIKGLGGTARLVMLPSESHGYRARESVLHSLAEMIGWFDRYVKNADPRQVTDGDGGR